MSDPSGLVRVEGVWKRFRRGELHDSLRDLLPALSRRLLRPPPNDRLGRNEFWALRDLNFTVRPGEALGLVGANGAGKSTALKILTRILRPTRGVIEVRGRIGALIEISAGFHGDLTGRENIFLQGAIMGMPQVLIREKFDQIVEFSGISEFLDTPVKRYSSGMNARLGFSIAAHLDPEVLIIDEVLAVGDYRFQERAFARIRELVTSGIPVVIVSHQLDRVAELCTSVVVLDHGTVGFVGGPVDAIAHYLSGTRSPGLSGGEAPLRLTALEVGASGAVDSGSQVRLTLRGAVADAEALDECVVALRIRSAATGRVVFATTSDRCGITEFPPAALALDIRLEMNVAPGVYAVEPYVVSRSSGKDLAAGPLAYIQVRDDPGFTGVAQLKPLMTLRPEA